MTDILDKFAKLADMTPIMAGRGENTRHRTPSDDEPFDFPHLITWGMLRDMRDSRPSTKYLDIVCDGPPSHEAGRFVEVENDQGRSVNAGEWIKRGDSYWSLRIKLEAFQQC